MSRPESSRRISRLLRAWTEGDDGALDELLPLVYDELHRLARSYLARERMGHTLQPTALVNEAYLRLADKSLPHWKDRVHFFAVAAQVMRRVLVDHARRRGAAKRGGDRVAVTLGEQATTAPPSIDLLALDEAMEALAALDPRKARVVELRFFAGLTIDETAHALDVSTPTVVNDSRFARAWLFQYLHAAHHDE